MDNNIGFPASTAVPEVTKPNSPNPSASGVTVSSTTLEFDEAFSAAFNFSTDTALLYTSIEPSKNSGVFRIPLIL